MADPVTATVAVGWGVSAVGWFASPVISELFKKGSSILGFSASEKLKVLEPKVLLLERVIELVEESPYRPSLEQLFNELKSTLREAEIILDDVEYHRLDRQIRDDRSEDGCVPPRKSYCLMVDKLRPAIPRSPLKNKVTGMSKRKLKKALEKIERIIDDAYKTVERLKLSNTSNDSGREATATSSHTNGTPPLMVIGRDQDRDTIVAWLHDKEDDGQPNANSGLCYSVVGIHGISGSGKTTLAQLIYDQEKKYRKEKRDDYFDLVLWVHVSQKFSVAAIYREMFDLAADLLMEDGLMNPVILNENPNGRILQTKLENVLRDKRFFLVLDDIGCAENLPQLLSPLSVGKRGSKVLVTCQNAHALSDLGPDVQTTHFPINDLNDDDFLKLFMYHALGDRATDHQEGSTLWGIGAHIATKLKRSPLAATIVGRQLRKRNIEVWRRAKDQDVLNETMGALSWSYQHLDQQVRQCFAYCSLFPVGHHLIRDELVRLWVAEGFIRNSTNTGKEMEDVGHECFDELVSNSFLQLGVERYYDYYTMNDLLHQLAERVAGSDCFRIDDGWKGKVPRGVRHLFVDDYNGEMLNIVGRTIELENLCTLIVSRVRFDQLYRLEEKLLKSMFKRLRKLRVLSVGLIRNTVLSVPANISLLKHLRFLSVRMGGPSCQLIVLPRTFSKLYHMQMLDFGGCKQLSSSGSGEEIINLVNLRYATTNLYEVLNIGRSASLQMLPFFSVRKHKLKMLRDLNKIHGSLIIYDLVVVESKEEALEAKLADKGRLIKLELSWGVGINNPQVEQAEVLEGLCPPTCLEELSIQDYSGATYPNWMVGNQSGGPKYLQELEFFKCSRIRPVPELFEVFTHLRSFSLCFCVSWDTLPDTIGHLRSLIKLKMHSCLSIRSLPHLPQSLQTFQLEDCDEEFMRSCQTTGDPNCQKIEHIATREFRPCLSSSPSNSNRLKGVAFDDNVSIIGA